MQKKSSFKIPISSEIVKKINKRSLLKSALYSARIEGNDLTLEEVVEIDREQTINSLLPRSYEIYFTIKEHGTISFDFIRRRFMAVPERTLRYDLKKLQEKNLIVKIGNTNGSFYRLSQDI